MKAWHISTVGFNGAHTKSRYWPVGRIDNRKDGLLANILNILNPHDLENLVGTLDLFLAYFGCNGTVCQATHDGAPLHNTTPDRVGARHLIRSSVHVVRDRMRKRKHIVK